MENFNKYLSMAVSRYCKKHGIDEEKLKNDYQNMEFVINRSYELRNILNNSDIHSSEEFYRNSIKLAADTLRAIAEKSTLAASHWIAFIFKLFLIRDSIIIVDLFNELGKDEKIIQAFSIAANKIVDTCGWKMTVEVMLALDPYFTDIFAKIIKGQIYTEIEMYKDMNHGCSFLKKEKCSNIMSYLNSNPSGAYKILGIAPHESAILEKMFKELYDALDANIVSTNTCFTSDTGLNSRFDEFINHQLFDPKY